MKMSKENYEALKEAFLKFKDTEVTIAECVKDKRVGTVWSILHSIPDSYELFIKPNYDLGLNDSHITTALIKIYKGIEW